jgi:peroxidase
MASNNILLNFFVILALTNSVFSQYLSQEFYDDVCPEALDVIRSVVEDAIINETRMGASLLRLHFHDCFVQGCDASNLLDSTSTMASEKFTTPNNNSLRGFDVIDAIKSKVDEVCGASIVSCADILAVAARDSTVILGGPDWDVELGRRDSLIGNATLSLINLPNSSLEYDVLLDHWTRHGLDERDLVSLSGGHTLGFSQCRFFRTRIYNNTDIVHSYARDLRKNCSAFPGDTDFNLEELDATPDRFDVSYYKNIMKYKALLHTDQILLNNTFTTELVKLYRYNPGVFAMDFASSMLRMGRMNVLTGKQGEVRRNCRVAN